MWKNWYVYVIGVIIGAVLVALNLSFIWFVVVIVVA